MKGISFRLRERLHLILILDIEVLKFVTPTVCQPPSFIGTEERPCTILLDTLHKEVRNPKSIEQVTSPTLLLQNMYYSEVKKKKGLNNHMITDAQIGRMQNP
jgi:hypothetical protein